MESFHNFSKKKQQKIIDVEEKKKGSCSLHGKSLIVGNIVWHDFLNEEQ